LWSTPAMPPRELRHPILCAVRAALWTRPHTRDPIAWDCDRRNSMGVSLNYFEETVAAGTAAKRVMPESRAELLQKVLSVRTEDPILAAMRARRAFLWRILFFFAFLAHGFLAEYECRAVHDESMEYLPDIIACKFTPRKATFADWDPFRYGTCAFSLHISEPCIIPNP